MRTVISQIALDQYVDLFNAISDGLSKQASFNQEVDILVKEAFNPFSWMKGVGRELLEKGITPSSRHMYEAKLTEGRKAFGKFFDSSEAAEKALQSIPSYERNRQLMLLADQDIEEAMKRRAGQVKGKAVSGPTQPAPVQAKEQVPAQSAPAQVKEPVPVNQADVEALETAAHGGGDNWYSNPWLAGAVGAAGIGIPLSALAYSKVKREAEDRARRAALIAGGAGFGTGVLAGRIIPRVGEKMMSFAERLQNWNDPYYWQQQQAMQQYPTYYG